MPAVRGEFLAMSVFYYAMHCLHELGPSPLTGWPSPSLAELRHAAEGFCSLNWGTLAGDEDVRPTILVLSPSCVYCVMCLYRIRLYRTKWDQVG